MAKTFLSDAALLNLSTRLDTAYDEQKKQVQMVFDAHSKVEVLETTYKTRRETTLLQYKENIKELGSNEELREAAIRKMNSELMMELDIAKSTLRAYQHELHLTSIEIEAARAQLRVAELLKANTDDK